MSRASSSSTDVPRASHWVLSPVWECLPVDQEAESDTELPVHRTMVDPSRLLLFSNPRSTGPQVHPAVSPLATLTEAQRSVEGLLASPSQLLRGLPMKRNSIVLARSAASSPGRKPVGRITAGPQSLAQQQHMGQQAHFQHQQQHQQQHATSYGSSPAAAGRNAGMSGPRSYPGGPPSPSGPGYHPSQPPHDQSTESSRFSILTFLAITAQVLTPPNSAVVWASPCLPRTTHQVMKPAETSLPAAPVASPLALATGRARTANKASRVPLLPSTASPRPSTFPLADLRTLLCATTMVQRPTTRVSIRLSGLSRLLVHLQARTAPASCRR